MNNIDDGAPGSHISRLVRSRSFDVDQLARYQWATQFAAGRRVLDVGCGLGYGCRILASAGAREVVGVDLAESVIEAAALEMPEGVRLELGDARALAYPPGSFELVVCFDLIEQIEEAGAVIGQLVRVLSEEGLLVISVPERDVVGDVQSLKQLPHVRLLRQEACLGSAIVAESGLSDDVCESAQIRTIEPRDCRSPNWLLVLAGRVSLPEPVPLVGLTDRLDFYNRQAALEAAEEQGRVRDEFVQKLTQDRKELQDRLLEAEQRLATVTGLEQANSELGSELAARDRELHALERVLRDVTSSASWRLTKPLRALKRILRQD
jgi:SAM-dependent methyltransferase